MLGWYSYWEDCIIKINTRIRDLCIHRRDLNVYTRVLNIYTINGVSYVTNQSPTYTNHRPIPRAEKIWLNITATAGFFFHGIPLNFQTRFHGSPPNFKVVFTRVNRLCITQKKIQENWVIWRSVSWSSPKVVYTEETRNYTKRSNHIHRERGFIRHEPEAYIHNESETNMYADLNVYTRDLNVDTRDRIMYTWDAVSCATNQRPIYELETNIYTEGT